MWIAQLRISTDGAQIGGDKCNVGVNTMKIQNAVSKVRVWKRVLNQRKARDGLESREMEKVSEGALDSERSAS